jgi:peptide/nickel transport system permease protein
MVRFIARRIAFILVIWVLTVFFCFLSMRMLPNSEISKPSFDVVGHGKVAWRETRAFARGVLRGDLGTANIDRNPIPIADLLRTSYFNSMGLLLVALICATVAGLYIGAAAALLKVKALVLPLLTLTLLGISTPSFFAGLLLQQAGIRYTDVFGRRLVSMGGFGWDLQHMLLPVLVLAARPLAYLTRAAFLALRQVMDQDYIRTAHAKGLSFRRTIYVHAIRNAAVPVLTAVGVSLRFALSTLPIVELFFAWPGLGRYLLQAIDKRQSAAVAALASALGLTFLAINLLLDVAYRLIDPRMREQ